MDNDHKHWDPRVLDLIASTGTILLPISRYAMPLYFLLALCLAPLCLELILLYT
jgi:hypothetical protein